MRGARILLFLLSAIYLARAGAQVNGDSLNKKETWALGLVAGSTYSGGSKLQQLGLNSGIVARFYLKKGFISTGLLFNNYKYYIGYSQALPYGYSNNFYNSFFHIYSIPLYYNIQSAGEKNRYYAGIGAEALYWRGGTSFNPGDLRIKYWLGAKAGLTFRSKGRFSFLIEFTLKETSVKVYYPGQINIHGQGYNLYLISGANAGFLYNF